MKTQLDEGRDRGVINGWFAKGKEAADACLKPDPRWKERCEKCFENNACEPPECRYFDGEDCQSPIPNQHPMAQPGNVAALREARPCNAHCDDYECEKNAGGVCRAPNPCLGYEEAGKVLAELEAAKRELAKSSAGGDAAKLREALEAIDKNTDLLDIAENIAPKLHPSHSFVAVQIRKIVRAALSAPPRNCDRFASADEALKAQEQMFNDSNFANGECKLGCPECDNPRVGCKIAWLFAPATEKEGGAK